jgi:hypothetical protein
MYRRSVLFPLPLALLILPSSNGEEQNATSEVVTIPLDQIWANDMPGTRDIDKLDPKRPLAYEIRRAIGFPTRDKEADPSFAVSGTGLEALRQAHAVLVKGKQRHATLPADRDVTLVFFVHETGPFVHLKMVERRDTNFDIYYHFVTP